MNCSVSVLRMEWNYKDIAKECTEYLAPNGFDAVQVAPVTEHAPQLTAGVGSVHVLYTVL